MSPSKENRPSRRSRKTHTTNRHDTASEHALDRAEPPSQLHTATIVALNKMGWRVTEIRPSLDPGARMWSVKIERIDFVATMTVTAPDPDVALEELSRYAATDKDQL